MTTPDDPSVGALKGLQEILSNQGLNFSDVDTWSMEQPWLQMPSLSDKVQNGTTHDTWIPRLSRDGIEHVTIFMIFFFSFLTRWHLGFYGAK
ncbi:MAG: hypothetical protein CM1200mP24_07080 [Gammaproteobacteria bacterium]|nr:MAG: hypothetical protein CM1200mP24_07080 [Gammaproteobacteria bacterium]